MKARPTPRLSKALALAFALAVGPLELAEAQTILMPWGNLEGMRVTDEPVDFEGGVRLVQTNWTGFASAVKYLQRPRYSRTGRGRTVESAIEGINFKAVVEDTGQGEAQLLLEVIAKTNLPLAGTFYCFDLPDAQFAGGVLTLMQADPASESRFVLASDSVDKMRGSLRKGLANGARIVGPSHTLQILWSSPRNVVIRRDASTHPTILNDPSVRQQFLTNGPSANPAGTQLYIELFAGDAVQERSTEMTMSLKATVTPDRNPVHLILDASKPGRPFDGIGGNFRLQFPETDEIVLGYNLNNLRSAWGRFDLYWAEWDPEEQVEPLATARAGRIHPKITGAIEVAKTLARRQMPIIVSAWVPPKWARYPGLQPAGLRGTALDSKKLDRICSSLTSYLTFLKEAAGVEAAYFSFNEPETGVEVRQTAVEHVEFIKAMGPRMARAGLKTKLLLGDTAHGTTTALSFIRPALSDNSTHRYIGAVAFHTWRGCTRETLAGWAEAARELGVPLLVTEAGPDAHLHEYPEVRLEPWFQLQEIELYVRICALAQPSTIMEWQLTTDYSVLAGAGIYGEPGPLKPTQRFWNLKQLGITPPGALALPISGDRLEVTAAAFGAPNKGQYTIHLVNRGSERRAVLVGLPEMITHLRRFTTDATHGMEKGDRIGVTGGRAEFVLPTASFITLVSEAAGP